MILFDTDTCVERLRGNKRILQRCDRYDGIVGISFMSIAELYYGAEKSKDPSRNINTIDNLLLSLEIIQTDIPILRRFGLIKAHLQKQGVIVADADLLIAATTLERAERLITGNSRHFERIPGLVTEDWR
ncbi:MAG: PIN domain-containing protein [Spirochaetes bacterium]|nr:PIN domain-containing protein [Spirochaetota bacterium]